MSDKGPGLYKPGWNVVLLMMALGYAARGIVLWLLPLMPFILVVLVLAVLYVLFIRGRR